MTESKEITWPQMLKLKNKDFSPFILEFKLVRPVDKNNVTAFAALPVKAFKGNKALVECDGEEWYAVAAENVYVYAR